MKESDGSVDLASPSMVQTIRRCGFAQYRRLARSHGRGRGSSNPAARLGNAAHEVLEWIALEFRDSRGGGLSEESVRSWWRKAVQQQADYAKDNEVERVFGAPRYWPGYALIEERLVVEFERLMLDKSWLAFGELRPEWNLTSQELGLRGTIDLCVLSTDDQAKLIDYKTGEVKAEDVSGEGRYRQQMLLYAALVLDAGFEPISAEVRPVGRRPIQVEFELTDIESAVDGVRRDVERYNETIAAGSFETLATPSEESCRWCEFAPTCQPMWDALTKNAEGIEAIAGEVDRIDRGNQGYISLRIKVASGSMEGIATLSRLRSDRFPITERIEVGSHILATGFQRSAPDNQVLIAKPSGLAQIVLDPA